MAIVTAENLTKHYGAGTNLTKALDGVSLTIAEGEFAAIAGASGSGKSTLLHLLGGLDRPTSGRVQIRGKDLYAMKEEELTVFRRREIGFVFQNYNLVPVLNVLENIVLPAELDGKDPDKTYIAQIVDALGLTEKLSNMPNTLSGGQQQRVAVARALAYKPHPKSLCRARHPAHHLHDFYRIQHRPELRGKLPGHAGAAQRHHSQHFLKQSQRQSDAANRGL